jgi:hypothetical protein
MRLCVVYFSFRFLYFLLLVYHAGDMQQSGTVRCGRADEAISGASHRAGRGVQSPEQKSTDGGVRLGVDI